MALTESEEQRIQRIENGLADINKAIKNLAAKRQLSHISGLFQKKLDALEKEVASLQAQLNAIKQ